MCVSLSLSRFRAPLLAPLNPGSQVITQASIFTNTWSLAGYTVRTQWTQKQDSWLTGVCDQIVCKRERGRLCWCRKTWQKISQYINPSLSLSFSLSHSLFLREREKVFMSKNLTKYKLLKNRNLTKYKSWKTASESIFVFQAGGCHARWNLYFHSQKSS